MRPSEFNASSFQTCETSLENSGTPCFLLTANILSEITALATGISLLDFWITNLINSFMSFTKLVLDPWETFSFWEHLFKSCDFSTSSSIVTFWWHQMFDASFLRQAQSYSRQHSFFEISTLLWSMLIHIIITIRFILLQKIYSHSNVTILPFPNNSFCGMMVEKVMSFLCTGVKISLYCPPNQVGKHSGFKGSLLFVLTWQIQFYFSQQSMPYQPLHLLRSFSISYLGSYCPSE